MSEESRHRRLYVTNRLEELRAKYGHEDSWDWVEYPVSGAGNVDRGTTEPLPLAVQKRSVNGEVTPHASPGHQLLQDIEL